MQGTQEPRVVTYLGRIYTPDCVFWLREHHGVAHIGEMHDQDFVLMSSGIESSLDLLTFASILTSILTVIKMVPT